MAENLRADRIDGLSRRYVTTTKEHRLKVHRWIARHAQDHPTERTFTINQALSRILGDAIDGIVE